MEQNDKDLELELELELEGIKKGVEDYRELKEKMQEKQQVSFMKPQKNLMIKLLDPLTEAIENAQNDCKNKTGRGRPKKYCCVQFLTLSPEKLALITVREAFNGCASIRTSRIINIVNRIADGIKLEIVLELFRKEFPEDKKGIKRYLEHHPGRKVIKWAKEKTGLTGLKAPRYARGTRWHLGSKLIKLLIDSTKAFERYELLEPIEKKTIRRLKISDDTRESLEKSHIKWGELALPVYRPMVCSPEPWKAPDKGGYLIIETPLVKGIKEEQLRKLEGAEMENVYKALNLIQATPWRINRKIYDLMKKYRESGKHLGVLPEGYLSIPEKPADYKTSKASQKEWKKRYREFRELKIRRKAKLDQFDRKLEIAELMCSYPKIYFPHSMDFRGRVYPLPEHLNPQGDDTARALLEFADGKHLGKHGAFWLAIYLANLFGKDKFSFKDRLDWVSDNKKAIIDSAEKPLVGEMFWTKAEKPWCFLAACFEWYGYSQEGEKWIFNIPVFMDGTCNGLQHYSALGKDEEGGKATNLKASKDSDTPDDIYNEVLKLVKEKVEEDAKADNQKALNWRGSLTRKHVKPGVMTTSYGVTGRGLLKQIYKTLKEQKVEQMSDESEIPGSIWDNALYLSKVLDDAIKNVVKAAPQYMEWLQEVASLLAKENIPIFWTTPVGFVVYQGKRRTKKRQVKTALQALTLNEEDPKQRIDTGKQKQGLPPNFIHSLDAAHMMMTVISAHEEYGISSFAMIHDAYGVHACDWDNFSRLIRQKFIEIYSKDILKEFRNEVQKQALTICLHHPPRKGDLDINEVLESLYFFS
jgi:DNA-directed RNA polymerase